MTRYVTRDDIKTRISHNIVYAIQLWYEDMVQKCMDVKKPLFADEII